MGSLSQITFSNSISYNTGKPGEQRRIVESNYEPVNPSFRDREQGISTITSYPYNPEHSTNRINTRRDRTVGMKNTTKATYMCICLTLMLALQIWTVIMIKYIEGRISKIVVRNDNLPIQKEYNIPGFLSLITKKLDLISRDTNYNIPYLIMNKDLPSGVDICCPKGLYIPYGTRTEIYIKDKKLQYGNKPNKNKEKNRYANKLEIRFTNTRSINCSMKFKNMTIKN